MTRIVSKPKGEKLKQLLSAIVLQAVKDLDDKEFKSDAEKFFESKWFETLVGELDMNPASMQKQALTRTYQRMTIRAGYH
jgi:hypothetical protein